MPLYDFQCNNCEWSDEFFFHVDTKPEYLDCGCGGKLRSVFLKAPSLHGEISDFYRKRFPYYDEALDQTFHTKKQKDDYLQKNGLRIREKGEKLRGHTKDPIAEKLASKVKVFSADSEKELNQKMDEKLKEIKETRRTHG